MARKRSVARRSGQAQVTGGHARQQTKVDYGRDTAKGGGHVPGVVREQLGLLGAMHTAARQQLDILRRTRGQRDVGAVKVPAHLHAPLVVDASGGPNSDRDVEARGAVAAVLPARE